MKLRLRCFESKETIRIQVASPCSLLQLQEALAVSLSPSPIAPSSLRFSLNAKDELCASSPHASIQSLGVTAGDLIYFSLNANAFSWNPSVVGPEALIAGPRTTRENPVRGLPQIQESRAKGTENLGESSGTYCPNQETPQPRSQEPQTSTLVPGMDRPKEEKEIEEFKNTQMVEGQETELTESASAEEEEAMEIDGDSLGKKFSEPYFLKRVLREELGDDVDARKLLVIAVHAVLQESGFLGFDTVSGMRSDKFHLPDVWPSSAFSICLCYTLPGIFGSVNIGSNVSEYVVLKFQSLGHFVNVYGSLPVAGSGLYKVCLDGCRFAPIIDLVWGNRDKNDRLDDEDGSLNSHTASEVFEFWKIIKDRLALPLLIELCDKTGLALPACLMRLPTELKLRILEFLPGVDIARMGCVCTEIRYLASNDDLWKQKFEEEFGNQMNNQIVTNWKERFATRWKARKRQKFIVNRQPYFHHVGRFRYPLIRRDPNPFGVPTIGGDYDRLPGLGFPSPYGQSVGTFPRFQVRRNFSPHCDLGGGHNA